MKAQKVVDLTSLQVEGDKVQCSYMVRYKKHWWSEWRYVYYNPYTKLFSEKDADAMVKFLKTLK